MTSTTDQPRQQRQHKARALQQWVIDHADTMFTMEEPNKALDWNLSSTGAALRRMADANPNQMESRSRGVYIWHSTPIKPDGVLEVVADLLVSIVVSKDDGTLLVKDSTTGALFAMKPFDF